MVQTINPAVSGELGSSWARAMLGFTLGAFVGACGCFLTTLLIVIGASQAGIGRPVVAIFAAATVLAGAREVGIPVPIPYRRCQVPVAWRQQQSLWRFSFSYGATLGLGFLTLFVTSAHLAALLGVAADPSWELALVSGSLFALGKSLPLVGAVGADSHSEVLRRLSTGDRNAYPRILMRRLAGLTATIMVAISLAETL